MYLLAVVGDCIHLSCLVVVSHFYVVNVVLNNCGTFITGCLTVATTAFQNQLCMSNQHLGSVYCTVTSLRAKLCVSAAVLNGLWQRHD